jgi:hypothetical protein
MSENVENKPAETVAPVVDETKATETAPAPVVEETPKVVSPLFTRSP